MITKNTMVAINLPSGKTQRTMVTSVNDKCISTGFGTFFKSEDGVYEWAADKRFTLVIEGNSNPQTNTPKYR